MKEVIEKKNQLNKVLSDIKTIASLLHQRGWAESNAGNISVNVTKELQYEDPGTLQIAEGFKLNKSYKHIAGQYFVMKGSGIRFRDLASEILTNSVLLKISDDGASYHYVVNNGSEFAKIKPTSELPTHLAIQNLLKLNGRSEKVVLHTHVNEFIALSHIEKYKSSEAINKLLFSMHPEVVINLPNGIGFVPYVLPGTDKIAQATIDLVNTHDLIVWEKHGIFSIGNSPCESFDKIDIATKAVRIFFMCSLAGYQPEGLTEDQINELRKTFLNS